MTSSLPPHFENPETSNTDPVFVFEWKWVPAPPGTMTCKRPPGREMPDLEDVSANKKNPPQEKYRPTAAACPTAGRRRN